ncbi:hypothetical protein FA15DRAFT_550705, partial [Coprinopsis marcescibilis]
TVTRLPKGGVQLEVNSREGAKWMRTEEIQKALAGLFGEKATVSGRGYKVEVRHVPMTWLHCEQELYRTLEGENNMQAGVIMDGRWRRAPLYWNPSQKLAHMTIAVMEATTDNRIIEKGLRLEGACIGATKPEPEPQRCYWCQMVGRNACEVKRCKSANPVCGSCASIGHETRVCKVGPEEYRYVSCGESGQPDKHVASDRTCPEWMQQRREMVERQPELGFQLYPTQEQDTW